MQDSTVRRTSSSSERSLGHADNADANDCPTPRAVSPSGTSQGGWPTGPSASSLAPGTGTVTVAAAPDGEDGGSTDGEAWDLEKLEEIVRKDEGVSNQLKQDAYREILTIAHAPHDSAEDSLARRTKALKIGFELYYLFSRDVDLGLLLGFLDEKEEKILIQAYASLPSLLHFCLLSPAALSKIKSSLLPLLPSALPPNPPTPLTSSFQSFAFHLLKKAPQSLIPDLFLPHNIQNHCSLLWLAAKYGEAVGTLESKGAGRVRREAESAVRRVFEGGEWAERVVGFWKEWAAVGKVSPGRLEAVNAWFGGPEPFAGTPPSPAAQGTKRATTPPASCSPEPKRPRPRPRPLPRPRPNPAPPEAAQPRSHNNPPRPTRYLGRNYDPFHRTRPFSAHRAQDPRPARWHSRHNP